MKIFTLIRHAKSSWENHEIDDFDRPLNDRGYGDATEMGKRLKNKNIIPDKVVVSPALRAISTAELIGRQLEISSDKFSREASIYDASPGDLMDIILNFPKNASHVFLIGHNPGLQIIGQFLIAKIITKFPTCAILSLELPIEHWIQAGPDGAKILFSDSPKHNFQIH